MRFSWNRVDERLIRKLLRAAYDEFGPRGRVSQVSSLTPEQLRRNAERVIGRPPKTSLRFALTDALRKGWLPNAKADELVNLTSLVNRYNALTTRQERLDFLLTRNRTDSFVANLWSAFIAAHKEPVLGPVRAGGASSRAKASVMELAGEDAQARHTPYAHQEHAWRELDRLRGAGGQRSGLLVIPTGGGKTATMVTWLVRELQRRSKLRVLWIADQQELVDQAAREFREHARTAPTSFRGRLRAVHGQAGSVSALADPEVDVVCITRQSLIGKQFDGRAKATIEGFLTGPTVVVIDEAHHAVSPSYQRLIEFLWKVGHGLMLVGLTATPWPAGAGQTAKLRQTFTRELASVTTAELVARGELARPVIHTVATDARVDVSAVHLKKLASGREVPAHVARQLDRESRNTLVVQQWVDRQDTWGKTLVFACDTTHANSLGDAFRSEGVTVDVVHSAGGADRAVVLDQFRNAEESRVLVSVGMLLEGVDIPSARTAFLCRPTASHIVMRQMIGRVLRGVRAGGDPEAHVVEFVDNWRQDGGLIRSGSILSPVDIPDVPSRPIGAGEGVGEHELPPILADDGETEVGIDLIRSIASAMAERVRLDGLTATLTSSQLIGFYDLDVRRVPVFAQATQAWNDAAAWASDPKDKRGTTAKSFFDDVPPPVPLDDEIAAFVDYCKSYLGAPPLVPLDASVDVVATARRLISAGPLSQMERVDLLRGEYESTLARSLYPSLQFFIEAVEQEVLAQLRVIESGSRPESVPTPDVTPAKTLRRDSRRDLKALFNEVVETGVSLLATEAVYDGWLDADILPDIDWTRRDIQAVWGYWSWRKGTKARDRPVIRINRALQAPKSQIPDDVLSYLIWHELCHHLTPGQGHDAEFRRLEGLWPDHSRLDHELDTLHEVYAMPKRAAK